MKRRRELEGQTALFGQLDLLNDCDAGPLEGPAGPSTTPAPAGASGDGGAPDGNR